MSTFARHDRIQNRTCRFGIVVEPSSADGSVCVMYDGDKLPTRTNCHELSLVSRVDADKTTNPPHYTKHPSGVECIEISEHFGFCLGNVIKYVWRAGSKGDALEDLKKARWYLDREIANREKEASK